MTWVKGEGGIMGRLGGMVRKRVKGRRGGRRRERIGVKGKRERDGDWEGGIGEKG